MHIFYAHLKGNFEEFWGDFGPHFYVHFRFYAHRYLAR